MANQPTLLNGHLAHNLLHTLADLDSQEKLLRITSLLKSTNSTTTEGSIKHPAGLVLFLIFQFSLMYLIRHLMLRSTGTLMVMTHMKDHRDKEHRAQSIHANLGSLRHAISSRRRLRKDIILGITYNVIYLTLKELLSCISSNPIWTILSQLAIDVLLFNLHLRWTGVILSSRMQTGSRIFSIPHRSLILPSALYILAWELTAKLPGTISRSLSVQDSDTLGSLKTVALTDAIILITSLSLRLLLLYPVYAMYIYTETKLLKSQDVAGSRTHRSVEQEESSEQGPNSYAENWKRCFKRTAPWFALLHLQTVFVLAVLEISTAPLLELLVF